MKRVLVLGRGGAGKSLFARKLGAIADLPVVELDKHFWQPGLSTIEREEWSVVQQELVQQDAWIIDGDLGPYDSALEARVGAADTVILLDFPLWVCAWRAGRRSRERLDFWRWVLAYRRKYLPRILDVVDGHGAGVDLHRFRRPGRRPLRDMAPLTRRDVMHPSTTGRVVSERPSSIPKVAVPRFRTPLHSRSSRARDRRIDTQRSHHCHGLGMRSRPSMSGSSRRRW